MAQNVILHLGAHQTGTTSLQAAFDDAAGLLQEAGIVALTPPRPGKRLRPTVRKLVNILVSTKRPFARIFTPLRRRKARQLLERLLEAQTGSTSLPDRLILSEEKMLGRAFGKDGLSIYPFARAHLTSIRRVLPVKVHEVHLTLRSYDTFLVSVYAMRALYAHNVAPFETIGEKLIQLRYGWIELVDAVEAVFPDAKIMLSVFEEHGLNKRAQSLLGEQGRQIAIGAHIPPPLNQAPTRDAIDMVHQAGRKPQDSDMMIHRYSDGEVFDPLDDATKCAMRKRYQSELATLRNRKTVHWIE